MEPPFHRRKRQTEKGGDSLERHLIVESKSQHQGIFRRYQLESRPYFLCFRFVFVRPGGRKRPHVLEKYRVHLDSICRTRLAAEAQSSMPGNRREPRSKLGRLLDRRQGFEGQ